MVDDFYIDYLAYLQDPILVSEPVGIAYIDKLMIGYYQDNIAGPVVYDKYKNMSSIIISLIWAICMIIHMSEYSLITIITVMAKMTNIIFT